MALFAKGQSGNPSGKPNYKPFSDQLRLICAQEDYKRLREAAEQMLTRAAEGDLVALEFLVDRLDGKPVQATEHSGPGGTVIQLVLSQSDAGIIGATDGGAGGG